MQHDGGYGGTEEGDGGAAWDGGPYGYYEDSDDGGYELPSDELDARIEQAVQQRVAPMEQAAYDAQRVAEAEHLVEMYPQLSEQDEAMALVRDARQAAEFLGAPELADQPRFWALVQQMRAEGGAAAGGQQVDPRVEAILTGGYPGAMGARVLEGLGGGRRGGQGGRGSAVLR